MAASKKRTSSVNRRTAQKRKAATRKPAGVKIPHPKRPRKSYHRAFSTKAKRGALYAKLFPVHMSATYLEASHVLEAWFAESRDHPDDAAMRRMLGNFIALGEIDRHRIFGTYELTKDGQKLRQEFLAAAMQRSAPLRSAPDTIRIGRAELQPPAVASDPGAIHIGREELRHALDMEHSPLERVMVLRTQENILGDTLDAHLVRKSELAAVLRECDIEIARTAVELGEKRRELDRALGLTSGGRGREEPRKPRTP